MPAAPLLLYSDGISASEFPNCDHINLLPGDAPVAVGGDLQPQRLLQAYSRGIFPWFSDDRHVLWWAPDPRCVLWSADYHIPRRLQRVLPKFELRINNDFAAVIQECSQPRDDHDGTWITPGMMAAYIRLHQLGYAESVAVYTDDRLVGGVYGVRLGGVFFGESMFSRVSGASRVALACLTGNIESAMPPCTLVDCQNPTTHLHSLGAVNISRKEFMDYLQSMIPDLDNV